MRAPPPKSVRCAWRHRHYEFMMANEMDVSRVHGFSRKRLRKHPGSVPTPRYRHALDVALLGPRWGAAFVGRNTEFCVWNCLASLPFLSCSTLSNPMKAMYSDPNCRAVDISQRPSQSVKCSGAEDKLHTITPDGIFFVPSLERPLTGEDKALCRNRR